MLHISRSSKQQDTLLLHVASQPPLLHLCIECKRLQALAAHAADQKAARAAGHTAVHMLATASSTPYAVGVPSAKQLLLLLPSSAQGACADSCQHIKMLAHTARHSFP
jgi:hypothetical protein